MWMYAWLERIRARPLVHLPKAELDVNGGRISGLPNNCPEIMGKAPWVCNIFLPLLFVIYLVLAVLFDRGKGRGACSI